MTGSNDSAKGVLSDYLSNLLDEDDIESPVISAVEVNSRMDLSDTKETLLVANPEPKKIERVERLFQDFNQRHPVTDYAERLDDQQIMSPVVLDLPQPAVLDSGPDNESIAQDSDSNDSQFKSPYQFEIKRPDWSERPFQILLFDVAGLILAVPLISLGGIHRIEHELTPLLGRPDWFMGLTPGHSGNINVVDSCRWVMPEKYEEAKAKGLNYAFIIMLGDSQWGLACSDVRDAKLVAPEEIKWRAESSKRPWLAGMLIEERCALLDVDVMINMLDSNYQR